MIEPKEGEGLPQELLEALAMHYYTGSRRALIAYIRSNGVPSTIVQTVADILEEGEDERDLARKASKRKILKFMENYREEFVHQQRLCKAGIPTDRRFKSIRAIQEYAAKLFYGPTGDPDTIQKIEQRNK